MKIKPRLKEDIRKYLLLKQKEEEEKVIIVSSYTLSDMELERLQELFPVIKGKKIEQHVDDSLIAGVVIKHGSKILDLSLKQRLMNLQHQINEIA